MTSDPDQPLLSVVHCMDTEGPMEEPTFATFERVEKRFGVRLEPTLENLASLQQGAISLNGLESEVAAFIAVDRLAYLETWRSVEEVVRQVASRAFRESHADPLGNPYCITWFIIDVLGYLDNPRRKPVGIHVVYDQYQRFLKDQLGNDAIGWHFHTVGPARHALDYNTSWTNNDFPEQSLARRLIERGAFPSVFRAGGVIERNDLSFWLENFIPFDFSSLAMEGGSGAPGECSDWRHAPVKWAGYHPDFYDYRREGAMRRTIFRCLEVQGFETVMNAAEVEAAFRQVRSGQQAVLAYSSHDRRNFIPEIEKMARLLKEVAAGYPDVAWRYDNAVSAARRCEGRPFEPAPVFRTEMKRGTLWIDSDRPLFGPLPFLAVEEKGELFYRDNPTIEGPTRWAYQPARPEKTKRIGLAGSNAAGVTGSLVLDFPA